MDVGNIKGSGRIERSPDRAQRTDRAREQRSEGTTAQDSATISSSGRETLQAVESLSEKLKEDPPERDQLVADAKARLESGALDHHDVYRKVASSLLEG